VTRVRVRVVATGIGGQPNKGADGCVRTVELDADHPVDDSPPSCRPARPMAGTFLLPPSTTATGSRATDRRIGTRQDAPIVIGFRVQAGPSRRGASRYQQPAKFDARDRGGRGHPK
jgi:hypothetical protein